MYNFAVFRLVSTYKIVIIHKPLYFIGKSVTYTY